MYIIIIIILFHLFKGISHNDKGKTTVLIYNPELPSSSLNIFFLESFFSTILNMGLFL